MPLEAPVIRTEVGLVMYVSSAFEDAIFVNAFGPSGFNALVQTLGYAGLPDDIMYADKQYVSFYSPTGISDITLTSYYGARIGAFVDDLNFEYTRVPEPSSLVLFAIGLLMFVGRRIFSYKKIPAFAVTWIIVTKIKTYNLNRGR